MAKQITGDAQGHSSRASSWHCWPAEPPTVTRSRPECGIEGFTDIAEGTVHALLVRIEQRGLVDIEKVPYEKGPPRKVYTLNPAGRDHLAQFWLTWDFVAERIENLEQKGIHAAWIEKITGSLERGKEYRQYKVRVRGSPGELPASGPGP